MNLFKLLWNKRYVIVFYENGSFCWKVKGWIDKDKSDSTEFWYGFFKLVMALVGGMIFIHNIDIYLNTNSFNSMVFGALGLYWAVLGACLNSK